MERIIGRYVGKERGALLIAMGAMHGNELAGVKAIEKLFAILKAEALYKPDFSLKGSVLGLRGNLQAIKQGKRFIDSDLNRLWTSTYVQRVRDNIFQIEEDREILEILEVIEQEIQSQNPSAILFLDLHTTSAEGGIFTIVTNDERSIEVAEQLYAPVIRGLLNGIEGTALHYFTSESLEKPTVALCFEAGQHQDPLSIDRAVAALVFALKAMDCIKEEDIETHHTQILQSYAQGLPTLSELLYCHKIQPEDAFVMAPNFQNFQKINKGQKIASDKSGDIVAPYDCRILMPLYQKQGNDGFFLIS